MFSVSGPRVDEGDTTSDSVVNVEAFVETQSSYILSKGTDLELTRVFNKTGVTYKVLLVAYNLVMLLITLKYDE